MKIRWNAKGLKWLVTILLLAVFVTAVYSFAEYAESSVRASSTQKRQAEFTPIDLDSSAAPLTGKDVYYFLTDEEGGLILDAVGQTRKVPARITYNYRGKAVTIINAKGEVQTVGGRDALGRLVSPLVIDRPPFAGGTFAKDAVPGDTSREPGTWDTKKPGDLRN